MLKNSAAGYDDITVANRKLVTMAVNQPLTYLCNLSFTQLRCFLTRTQTGKRSTITQIGWPLQFQQL